MIKYLRFLPRFFLSLLSAGLISTIAFADFADMKDSNKTYSDDQWLDWEEDEVTSVPDFVLKRAIPVELNKSTQMKWFVDPDTMSIGKDNVFRYVVIAQGQTGTINAFYEGVLCKNAESKTYAKMISTDGQPPYKWRMIEKPEWKSLDKISSYNYQKALARDFICDGAARPTSIHDVKRRMKDFNYDVTTN